MADVSIKDKLKDVVISDEEFTNTENGEVVGYKTINLIVEFEGVEEVVPARIPKSFGKAGYRLLTLADEL